MLDSNDVQDRQLNTRLVGLMLSTLGNYFVVGDYDGAAAVSDPDDHDDQPCRNKD